MGEKRKCKTARELEKIVKLKLSQVKSLRGEKRECKTARELEKIVTVFMIRRIHFSLDKNNINGFYLKPNQVECFDYLLEL